MDKLSQDATNAIKAGMSYGQYMALKNPVTISAPQPQKVQSEPEKKGPVMKTCAICGKEFLSRDRRCKYCGPFCARVAASQRIRRHQLEKQHNRRNQL